jgi:hypothetical protein
MLKVVYAFFVGILLAFFVGVGVSTFYTEPTYPTAPSIYSRPVVDPNDADFKAQEADYNKAQEQYNKDISTYNRNVSIITLVWAVLFLSIGLILASRIHVISDGLLLGGVFTLIYSLFRGFISQENSYRFGIITVGLIVALVLGYIKFIKPEQTGKKKRKG